MSTPPSLRASNSGNVPALEFISDSEDIKVVPMTADRLTIGRHDNNDVVLPSESVSRYHAVIEKSAGGYFFIRDKGSKNGVQINGETITEYVFEGGELIQIGDFTFRFVLPAGALVEAQDANLAESLLYQEESAPPPPKKGLNKRVIIYGGAFLIIALVLYMNNSASPPEKTAKETETIADSKEPPKLQLSERDAKGYSKDPLLNQAEQSLQKLDTKNEAIKEAEQYFKKGQREYDNKNYHRAMDAFRAALSLNRSHELAEYYYRLSIFEAENEAKKNFEIGRKYFESMQYARAIYHFNETTALLLHRPNDKLIPAAQKYIDLAKRRLEATEFSP